MSSANDKPILIDYTPVIFVPWYCAENEWLRCFGPAYELCPKRHESPASSLPHFVPRRQPQSMSIRSLTLRAWRKRERSLDDVTRLLVHVTRGRVQSATPDTRKAPHPRSRPRYSDCLLRTFLLAPNCSGLSASITFPSTGPGITRRYSLAEPGVQTERGIVVCYGHTLDNNRRKTHAYTKTTRKKTTGSRKHTSNLTIGFLRKWFHVLK